MYFYAETDRQKHMLVHYAEAAKKTRLRSLHQRCSFCLDKQFFLATELLLPKFHSFHLCISIFEAFFLLKNVFGILCFSFSFSLVLIRKFEERRVYMFMIVFPCSADSYCAMKIALIYLHSFLLCASSSFYLNFVPRRHARR